MVLDKFNSVRMFNTDALQADFVIVGGGISGVCAAITAARQGLKVVLIQDRPVLGGNGSSEIRLWMLGATSHMGNNNRWAREGGVIDEIMVEHTFRNPEGNPIIFDSVMLDKVVSEPNITLLLNTCCLLYTSFAPVMGMRDSHVKAGQVIERKFVVGILPAGWNEVIEYISDQVYKVKDYRKQKEVSLTEAMFNILDLMRNEEYGGWDARLKGFYDIEMCIRDSFNS